MTRVIALLLLAACAGTSPVELGAVSWDSGFDGAAAAAKKAGKPLLVLFQEVPGWATCKTFGRKVLTHPLIVDAAETLFVPVCVRNNTSGDADAKTLAAFREPAWNNPVVRVVDADRKDLAPRLGRDWSVAGLTRTMAAGLVAANGAAASAKVPEWFSIFAAEQAARRRKLETAVYGMGWFWTGEAGLGLVDGVVSTRPGWHASGEVVEVEYDPRAVSLESLTAAAKKAGARLVAKGDGERIRTADDKYHLSRTPLRFVPMTPLQATRVNARVGKGLSLEGSLSPSQRRLLAAVKEHPDADWPVAIGADFRAAWAAAEKVRETLGK